MTNALTSRPSSGTLPSLKLETRLIPLVIVRPLNSRNSITLWNNYGGIIRCTQRTVFGLLEIHPLKPSKIERLRRPWQTVPDDMQTRKRADQASCDDPPPKKLAGRWSDADRYLKSFEILWCCSVNDDQRLAGQTRSCRLGVGGSRPLLTWPMPGSLFSCIFRRMRGVLKEEGNLVKWSCSDSCHSNWRSWNLFCRANYHWADVSASQGAVSQPSCTVFQGRGHVEQPFILGLLQSLH